ncbi:MAG: hypothetical protein LBK99_05145, partial [Opitutaceae bacterium]|jgi:hypothetical protein|nr:hypothetical protein [Opitutaceae bacterium]
MAQMHYASVARDNLGLSDDKTTWTQAQKDAYLAEYYRLRTLADDIDPVAAANYEAWTHVAQDIEDFDSMDWYNATIDALGESLSGIPATIGQWVDTAADRVTNATPTWLKWTLGTAAVLGILHVARPYLLRTKGKE